MFMGFLELEPPEGSPLERLGLLLREHGSSLHDVRALTGSRREWLEPMPPGHAPLHAYGRHGELCVITANGGKYHRHASDLRPPRATSAARHTAVS